MFDIGFSELFVIAVVALIVLGPERLPRAARFTGLWVRRARAQWYSVRSELENELAAEDLRRSLRQTQEELREAHEALQRSGSELQDSFALDHGADPPLRNASAPHAGTALDADAAAPNAPAVAVPTSRPVDSDER